METIFPKISPKDQEILDAIGLKPYRGRKLSSIVNPNSPLYWGSLAAMMLSFNYLRRKTAITRGPKMLYTITVVCIPIFGILNHRMMINNQEKNMSYALQYKALNNPNTKRIYEEALMINEEYQKKLRAEIYKLENEE